MSDYHQFTLDGAAGAAFLLKTPAPMPFVLRRAGGEVRIREGAPYIIICFSSMPKISEPLPAIAWKLVQEALDIFAATHRRPLITDRAEFENISWVLADDGYQLTISDTTDMRYEISATVTTGSGPGKIDNSEYGHHISLRFYRLSLASEDLFDSFRNAYLCLECLVSDESPKGEKEYERPWLKRVLGGPLKPGVPDDIDVSEFIDDIYREGRLPLFHAKMERHFYIGDEPDREAIRSRLEKLIWMLSSLLHYKYDRRFSLGWSKMYEVGRDAMIRPVLKIDGIEYRCGNASEEGSARVEISDSPRRFGNLTALIKASRPTVVGCVERIVLISKGAAYITLDFQEPIPVHKAVEVRFAMAFSVGSTRTPKWIYDSE